MTIHAHIRIINVDYIGDIELVDDTERVIACNPIDGGINGFNVTIVGYSRRQNERS